jgi:hypothetical protein
MHGVQATIAFGCNYKIEDRGVKAGLVDDHVNLAIANQFLQIFNILAACNGRRGHLQLQSIPCFFIISYRYGEI